MVMDYMNYQLVLDIHLPDSQVVVHKVPDQLISLQGHSSSFIDKGSVKWIQHLLHRKVMDYKIYHLVIDKLLLDSEVVVSFNKVSLQ
jgi:hypothetical protein